MKHLLFILLFLLVNTKALYAFEERFSGNPIPRFASISRSDVNARFGPSTTYPIKYVYKLKSQPVKIINEYYGWYQIKDVDDDISWIYKSYIGKDNFVITTSDNINLYEKAKQDSDIIAKLNKNIVLFLDYCEDSYCHVKLKYNGDDYEGYINKLHIWGI